jgi:predicted GIY-YIG superfamily endonuclease
MPAELVFECAAGQRGDALRLEHRVKRMTRREKEELIAGSVSILPDQASGDSPG